MRNSENGRQDKLDWFDGKHINEILFCQEFLKTHPMRCIGGTLFTVDGPVESEELVKRQIIDMIQSCVTTNLSKRSSALLESLKIQAYSEPLPVELDRIHCANGIYFLDGNFESNKVFCNNRLAVRYNPLASISFRTFGGGRYSHFTGVSGLLPDPIHQRSENAYADRQRWRGKISYWVDSQRYAAQRHECRKYSESRDKPLCPC